MGEGNLGFEQHLTLGTDKEGGVIFGGGVEKGAGYILLWRTNGH